MNRKGAKEGGSAGSAENRSVPDPALPRPQPSEDLPCVVCAWCKVLIRQGDPRRVSHGICPPCKAALRKQHLPPRPLPAKPGGKV